MALDEAIEVLDSRFYRLVIHNAHVEHLWSGARWAEGPVYVPSAQHLVFSDIPNDTTLRYDERTGSVDVFESPAFNALSLIHISEPTRPERIGGGGVCG